MADGPNGLITTQSVVGRVVVACNTKKGDATILGKKTQKRPISRGIS